MFNDLTREANRLLYKAHKRNERKEEYPVMTNDRLRGIRKKELLFDDRALEQNAVTEHYRIRYNKFQCG